MTIVKKENRRLSGAPITMHKRGQITDSFIIKVVNEKPGVTVSEIAELLNWSNGKTDGSINRLLSKKKITIKHYLKRGMLVKKVYPINHVEKPKNVIEVSLKTIDAAVWEKSVFVYALSRSTIGLSPTEISEWDEKALFKECVNFTKNKDSINIRLPDKIEMFYQLENSDVSLSTIGNLVLITIESVLPVNLPPKNSEEHSINNLGFTPNREKIKISSQT